MVIYIAADMEGASCIACRELTDKNNPRYEEGRRLLTADVNAAITGALEGGARDVWVADAHNGSFNLIAEALHPRARLLVGVPQAGPRLAMLDGNVDGLFLVAYHAMAGTLHATLEHTMTSAAWHSVRVNGRPVGELAIDAGMAARAGVPTIMVSGDDKLCAEAQSFIPGIERACVKQGLGRHHAMCLSPAEGQARIRQAARRSVERLRAGERFPLIDFGSPVTISITYKHTEDADAAAASYGAHRVDGYTVEQVFPCFEDWYGGLWTGGAPVI